MMYAVLKNECGKDMGYDTDGTAHSDLDHAELMSLSEATRLAESVGGTVISEQRLFGDGDDWD